MNEIKTDLEVVNGKPVVTVKNGWYPLKEGVDYTLFLGVSEKSIQAPGDGQRDRNLYWQHGGGY